MGRNFPYASKRGKPMKKNIVKQTFAVNALAVSVVGATGIGFGSVAIEGLPEGNLLILGAVANLQFTAGANTTTTWTGSFAIGSSANADTSLSGTEIDFVGATTINAATASVSPITRGTGAVQSIVDNTDLSKVLNLNVLIDDASISGTTPVTVSGFVSLAMIVLGDD